jgi:hypothetical protein
VYNSYFYSQGKNPLEIDDVSETLIVPSYYKRPEDSSHVRGPKPEVRNPIGATKHTSKLVILIICLTRLNYRVLRRIFGPKRDEVTGG